LSFNGLSVSIPGCSYTLNGAAQSSGATDGLTLQQVAAGRGNVLLEVSPTGSAIFSSATSSALTAVNYTLSVATNLPATAKVSS
jgi:hypothetical protein